MSLFFLEQPADFFVLRRISPIFGNEQEEAPPKYEVVSELLKGLVILKEEENDDEDEEEKIQLKAVGYLSGGALIPLTKAQSQDETLLKHFIPAPVAKPVAAKKAAASFKKKEEVSGAAASFKKKEEVSGAEEKDEDTFILVPIRGMKELYRVVGGTLEGLAVFIADGEDPEDDAKPMVKGFIKDGKLFPLSLEQKKTPLLLKHFTL